MRVLLEETQGGRQMRVGWPLKMEEEFKVTQPQAQGHLDTRSQTGEEGSPAVCGERAACCHLNLGLLAPEQREDLGY